jgi:hypothetical protein
MIMTECGGLGVEVIEQDCEAESAGVGSTDTNFRLLVLGCTKKVGVQED